MTTILILKSKCVLIEIRIIGIRGNHTILKTECEKIVGFSCIELDDQYCARHTIYTGSYGGRTPFRAKRTTGIPIRIRTVIARPSLVAAQPGS